MKEFDLEAALNGEPVKLANGNKAIVYYLIPDEYVFEGGAPVEFPLRGLIFNSRGVIENVGACWRDDGRFNYHGDPFNIIGMWEEPKISIEDLPKPFKPKDGEPYFYITGGFIEYESEFWGINNFEIAAAERGGCYRTREDAQKWLDFMKSMME